MNKDDSGSEERETEAPPEEGTAATTPKEVSTLGSSFEVVPPEVREVLRDAPPQLRERIEAFFAMTFRGPVSDQIRLRLIEKFGPEHISQFLESVDQDTEREYKDARNRRLYSFLCLVCGLVFFGFLVFQLATSNPDLLRDLITSIGIFVGGFGGGYGLRALRSNRDSR